MGKESSETTERIQEVSHTTIRNTVHTGTTVLITSKTYFFIISSYMYLRHISLVSLLDQADTNKIGNIDLQN